jgi:glycosyltransferase involved in cell wall biosynthesis
VASIYTTSAPDRISAGDHFEAADATIRLRSMGQRPLRVLAYNSLFPLVPETYIADEMKGLTDNGAVLAWCTDRWSPSPVTVAEPTYTDLDTAVRTFDPDVLVVFWAAFAAQRLDHLGRAGKPFALRVHSFDFALEDIDRVRAHPLCVGVWAYPHHAHRIDGAHGLVPLLTSGGTFPEPGERTIVLSASAALPKKDWPLLVAAFAELADKGVDCRIVVGLTDKHEDEPDTVRQLIRHSGASIKLSVDVPHDQVIELLGRTAVVVYSKVSGGPFGMPRSIIEGMYAGTSVILPDRPEAPLVAGPGCRTYRRADDIVGHCLEVLAGGRDIESERRRNRRFAADNYADPDLATMFTAQLARALTRWRAPH